MPKIERALGEIALRVSDLNKMQEFYETIVGLELLRRFPDSAFFRITEGLAGHIQILALFDRKAQSGYSGISSQHSTIDHIAFSMSLENFRQEEARLLGLGLKLKFAEHEWTQWRSLYFQDPEGTTVEFVCYDEAVRSQNESDL